MTVKKDSFGRLPDGREVFRYLLRNGRGTEASFLDYGAIWHGMRVRDREGGFRDILLGVGSAEHLPENPGHMGEIIGRNANRVGGAGFSLNGIHFSLGRNAGGDFNLHSGPDYYGRRFWKAELPREENSVCFSLHSPDGDQGYPASLEFSVSYTLSEDDLLSIRYLGISDRDTVLNPTNHAYFNLNGEGSGSIGGQYVQIFADCYTPTDSASIPTGEIAPLDGTALDFREERRISERIEADFPPLRISGGYDQNFCLRGSGREERLAARARSEESGIGLELRTDLPGLQFYSANSMDAKGIGKGGKDYGRRSGFCFETQYYPDSVNQRSFLSPVLRGGERWESVSSYRFTLERRK